MRNDLDIKGATDDQLDEWLAAISDNRHDATGRQHARMDAQEVAIYAELDSRGGTPDICLIIFGPEADGDRPCGEFFRTQEEASDFGTFLTAKGYGWSLGGYPDIGISNLPTVAQAIVWFNNNGYTGEGA